MYFYCECAHLCPSLPLESKKEAVRRILASMTVSDSQDQGATDDYTDQQGLGLGDYDHQEAVQPQGPSPPSS